ncbi:TKL protein kinase [Saprolegnia diclina VS20]|uniref:TKL protein kinase n=1 Tax=Saprolegnia diclina (strain VS20) TaxID=1156394 RepID=T0QPR6_SAPDV|nr:TKL protein kinase [Saprolegnia diclina VS20]EQC40109.1 TKL protein kinase [Saprolegnia diclina VS20]|eukprot:XP_008606583.1 TKL protein kinase [Saprolegnia diclina VS20]
MRTGRTLLLVGLALLGVMGADNVTTDPTPTTLTPAPAPTPTPTTKTPTQTPQTLAPQSTQAPQNTQSTQKPQGTQAPVPTVAKTHYTIVDGWRCVGLLNNTVFTIARNNSDGTRECASMYNYDCTQTNSERDCNGILVSFDATPFSCSTVEPLNNNTIGHAFYEEYCRNIPSGSSWTSNQTIILVVSLVAAAAIGIIIIMVYKKKRAARYAARTPTEDINNPGDHIVLRSQSGKRSFLAEPAAAYYAHDSAADAELHLGDLALHRLDSTRLREVRVLATGAHGIVSLGDYKGEQVAMKRLLHPDRARDAVQSFIDEIKLMARMDSPYIVRFIGVAWNRPRDMTLVLEYMSYGDLRDHLTNTEADPASLFPWDQKILCALDVVNGLIYLHANAIIHRDLKSRNVLLTQHARGKLIDFGVSREAIEATMTQGIGTYRWTAPEVLRGKRYTVAADMYSFGIMLSEFATHQVPFWDAHLRVSLDGQSTEPLSDFALLDRLRDGTIRPTFTETSPEWLVELAEQCLSYVPEERPTAVHVSAILQHMYDRMFPAHMSSTSPPSHAQRLYRTSAAS